MDQAAEVVKPRSAEGKPYVPALFRASLQQGINAIVARETDSLMTHGEAELDALYGGGSDAVSAFGGKPRDGRPEAYNRWIDAVRMRKELEEKFGGKKTTREEVVGIKTRLEQEADKYFCEHPQAEADEVILHSFLGVLSPLQAAVSGQREIVGQIGANRHALAYVHSIEENVDYLAKMKIKFMEAGKTEPEADAIIAHSFSERIQEIADDREKIVTRLTPAFGRYDESGRLIASQIPLARDVVDLLQSSGLWRDEYRPESSKTLGVDVISDEAYEALDRMPATLPEEVKTAYAAYKKAPAAPAASSKSGS